MGLECILSSGDDVGLPNGVSTRGVAGCEATLASRAEALVGLPDPESLRLAIVDWVVRHGEETVEGVNGGRRVPDVDRGCCGGCVGSE
jgi:hypothetical protein